MPNKKSNFEPLGQFVSVLTDKDKKEKTTDYGIIYKEHDSVGRYVLSKIVMVGPKVESRIKTGDMVYWDSKEFKEKNEVDGMQIIHESWIVGVMEE